MQATALTISSKMLGCSKFVRESIRVTLISNNKQTGVKESVGGGDYLDRGNDNQSTATRNRGIPVGGEFPSMVR